MRAAGILVVIFLIVAVFPRRGAAAVSTPDAAGEPAADGSAIDTSDPPDRVHQESPFQRWVGAKVQEWSQAMSRRIADTIAEHYDPNAVPVVLFAIGMMFLALGRGATLLPRAARIVGLAIVGFALCDAIWWWRPWHVEAAVPGKPTVESPVGQTESLHQSLKQRTAFTPTPGESAIQS